MSKKMSATHYADWQDLRRNVRHANARADFIHLNEGGANSLTRPAGSGPTRIGYADLHDKLERKEPTHKD